MTDNPDDPNAEAGQEQSAVVEEEVWQGNEPPVDDFADPAAGEAEASVTQEEGEAPLEEGAEAETETEAAAGETAPKKRGLLIPAVVALVGAGALAGALYWQFGGSSNNPAPQMMAQAPLRTMPMTAPPPATTPAPVMPPSSASDMPPVSASTLTSSSPSGVATPLPSPPASVTTSVTITQAPASAPTFPAAAPASVSPVAAPSAATGTGTQARLELLTARVEEMQRALDQATQQMAELSTKLAAAQTQAPPPNPQIEMRLNGIEQKLNQVAQAPAAQPAAVMQEAPSAPRPAVHKTMHVSAPAPVRHKAAPPPEEIEEANVWVLRAATPDQAWVAKDASTPDLKPVHVGDTLPGIGRVVAIEETTSGWVVQGTHASVR